MATSNIAWGAVNAIAKKRAAKLTTKYAARAALGNVCIAITVGVELYNLYRLFKKRKTSTRSIRYI